MKKPATLTITFVFALSNCGTPESRPESTREEAAWFTEITDQVGLDFRHAAGQRGDYHLAEIAGSGGALFDYDGDGDLDIYLIDGGSKSGGAPNQMFRHDSDGGFTNVTDASGLGDAGWGMGSALGDVDNDGDLDLYVTNLGADSFYLNAGDGTFQALPAPAGLDEARWSSSACFFDYDRDGLLDLFVATYLDFDPDKECTDLAGRPDYCGPAAFRGLPDFLFRGGGDGTFVDVSDTVLVGRLANKALGVVCADFDGDARTDVYVANDGEQNQLWRNLGGSSGANGVTFEDGALLRGAALNIFARPEASMGVAAGDVDGDLDLDLFMTHLNRETNTLYLNLGEAGFEDRTAASGLGPAGLAYTGFGTGLFDADLDGDLDLVVVNGGVSRAGLSTERTWQAEETVPPLSRDYAEPNLFFENDGTGSFQDASARSGRLAVAAEVSRGLLLGDLDSDGDLDVVLTNCGGPARLYRNDAPRKGHWLVVRAIDPTLHRDALGAMVEVRAGGRSHLRPVISAYSYFSAGEPTVHFGLGEVERIDGLTVVWPDGTREEFPGVDLDRRVEVRKGEGLGG